MPSKVREAGSGVVAVNASKVTFPETEVISKFPAVVANLESGLYKGAPVNGPIEVVKS